MRSDEEALRQEIVATACAYGRYGYRRVTALLKRDGWRVNHKRVERIWRQEGPESAPETAPATPVVDERWFVHTTAA